MLKFLMLFGALIYAFSATAYERCSDSADGFLFAEHTSVMFLNSSNVWQESNSFFKDSYAIKIVGEVKHEGSERLLYVKVFNPGDRVCSNAVVKASQVYLLREERSLVRCAQNIEGIIDSTRTNPLFRDGNGRWYKRKNRSYTGNFEFETIETVSSGNGHAILIVLMNTRSDYRCSFGAVLKREVINLDTHN